MKRGTRPERGTYRVAVGDDDTVLDVNVHVSVCDLNTVDDLANVDVGDARGRIGIGVLPDGERVGRRVLLSKMFSNKLAGDIKWVVRTNEATRDSDGLDMELGMGVNRTEVKRLARRDARVSDGAAGKPRESEGGGG